MRRVVMLFVLSVLAASALALGRAPVASAGCSTIGGFQPFWNTSLHDHWFATCSDPNNTWKVQVIPQYENGGTWHTFNPDNDVKTFGPVGNGSSFDQTNQWSDIIDVPGDLCRDFNWRVKIWAYNPANGNATVGQAFSAELKKPSCP
jgi:hypothetical protein